MRKARINDKDIDSFQLVTTSSNTVNQVQDQSLLVRNKSIVRNVRVSGTITDNETAEQLKEMFDNETFNIIDFTNTDLEREMLNGKFSLTSGNVSQQSDKAFNYNFNVDGPFQRIQWLVSSDEFDTDWDTIATEPFTEGGADNDFNEGAEATLDSGYIWHASSGDWRVDGADDFLRCDADSGTNHCLFVSKAAAVGYYPAVANVIVQGEVMTLADVDLYYGLALRHTLDDGATASGYGYWFGYNTVDDCYQFRRCEGAGNSEVKSWLTVDGWDLDYNTVYTLKVVCQGNRFDCYADDADGVLRFIGTVHDDTYETGYYGFTSEDHNNVTFDDFSLSIAKAQPVNPPVGTGDVDQITMQTSTKLNDNVSADGYQQTVIAPDNPVTFDQQIQELNDSSCVLWLPLDEGRGDTIHDHSGNDNDGTITTAAWREEYLNGKNRKYLKFDGVADLVTMDDAFDHYHNVTITALINADTVGTRIAIFDGRDADNDGIILELNASSQLECQYQTVDITSTSTLTAGTWYLVSVVIDKGAGTSQLYIDGIADGSEGDISAVNVGGITTVAKIGRFCYAASNYFDGKIAFVQAHNRALTATEIKYKYDSLQLNTSTGGEVKVWDTNGEDGYWDYLEFRAKLDENYSNVLYDNSKNNRAITIWGIDGDEWSTSYNKWAKTSLLFNGTDEAFYPTMGGEGLESNGWSFGTWFNASTTNDNEGPFSVYDGAGGGYCLRVYFNTNKLRLLLVTDDTNGQWTTTTDTYSTGQWYFIVITWGGTVSDTPVLYINGSSVALTEDTTPVGNVYDIDRFMVGYSGAGYFEGYIDDPFVYSRELSADRIAWLYENMPDMVDESLWTRVFDPHHSFKGDLIVDNSLIRFSQTFKHFDDSAVTPDTTRLKIWPYSNGTWEDKYFMFGAFSDYYFADDKPIAIKSIEKHKVVIEAEVRTNHEVQFLNLDLIISQSPFMLVKITGWLLHADLDIYGRFNRDHDSDHMIYNNMRFACPSLDLMYDSIIDVAGADTDSDETEGLSLAFDAQHDVIAMYFDEDSTDWGCNAHTNARKLSTLYNDSAIDFDADNPPHYFALGIMPFDTSLLHWDHSNLDLFGTAQTAADGATSTGTRIELLAINDRADSGSTYFPAGSYRIFVRAAKAVNDGTLLLGFYNITDAGWEDYGSLTINNVAYSWYSVDVIIAAANEEDNIRLYIYNNDAADDDIYIDEAVIWPLWNSKNFPGDYRDQMLANISVDEELGDET